MGGSMRRVRMKHLALPKSKASACGFASGVLVVAPTQRMLTDDHMLLAVLIFVATHKINSAQYGVWIAAMTAGALTFSGSRVRGPAVLLALMLLLAAGAIWPNFIPLTGGNPIFLGYQGVRLVLLLVAVAWLAKAIFWDQREFNARASQQTLTQ